MPSSNLRSGMLRVSAIALLLCAGAANADPVSLVGGASDPYDSGFVPVPPSPAIPYTAADIGAMSDGNDATGFQFTLRNGDFTSNPLSTVGWQQRFDFDVSGYESIDGIDFTWTGRYELGAPIFASVSQIWLSAGDGGQVRAFNNGNDLGTDLLHTYTASWERLDEGFDDVDALLHEGLASVYVQTGGVGFTLGDPILPFHTLDTREVVANVRGTLKNVSVPEPGTFVLLGAGLLLLAFMRRRPLAV